MFVSPIPLSLLPRFFFLCPRSLPSGDTNKFMSRAPPENMVVGEGFEPSKAKPSDLQSDPFDHSGTPPSKPAIVMLPQTGVNGVIPEKF